MDKRDAILQELLTWYDEMGPNNYVLADTLRAFKFGDKEYLGAMNKLIAEGLVLAIEAPNSRVAVALNPRKHAAAKPTVQSNVTINLGPGASFTGPVAAGQSISQSFSFANATPNEELRKQLQALVVLVGRLVEAIPDEDGKKEVAAQLSVLVEQAKKDHPSKRLLKVTGEGLIEAAKTIANMAGPVTAAVKAVLDMLV